MNENKLQGPGFCCPAWAKKANNEVAFGSVHLLAGSVSFGQKLFGQQTFGWTCKKSTLQPNDGVIAMLAQRVGRNQPIFFCPNVLWCWSNVCRPNVC
jgi:hypothetical protein